MKKINRILCLLFTCILLLSMTAVAYANDEKKIEKSLEGYSYNANPEKEFMYTGEAKLELDTNKHIGVLTLGEKEYTLKFNIESLGNNEYNADGVAYHDGIEYSLLMTIVQDEGQKVFGLLGDEIAFNVGKTKEYKEVQQILKTMTLDSEDSITSIEPLSSSDSRVRSQDTRRNLYCQLVGPSNLSIGQTGHYHFRMNTTFEGNDPIMSIRRYTVRGTVNNAYIISSNPSGSGTAPTTIFEWVIYQIAGQVGISIDGSSGQRYNSSWFEPSFEIWANSNQRWTDSYYSSDSNRDGLAYRLTIERTSSSRPQISATYEAYVYIGLIGYSTFTGPTLSTTIN